MKNLVIVDGIPVPKFKRTCQHEPMQPESCHLCWFQANNGNVNPPAFITRPEVAGPIAPGESNAKAMVQRLGCVHLGDKVPGQPCGSALFKCNYDGTVCSKLKPCTGAARCCQICPHFETSKPAAVARQPIHAISDTRHILYHVWPVRGNGMWERNLHTLQSRIGQFNGRRFAAVVGDPNADDVERATGKLRGLGFEVLQCGANDAAYRETLTWHRLWDALALHDAQPDDAVFYAHARGVWRGPSAWRWSEMMYESLLDYPDVVRDSLTRHHVTGSFKKHDNSFTGSPWHYSGAFFWSRYGSVAPKVRFITPQWYGVEAWPGLHFSTEQAGVVFYEGRNFNLYSGDVLSRVQAEYAQWRAEHTRHDPTLSPTGLLTAGPSVTAL